MTRSTASAVALALNSTVSLLPFWPLLRIVPMAVPSKLTVRPDTPTWPVPAP